MGVYSFHNFGDKHIAAFSVSVPIGIVIFPKLLFHITYELKLFVLNQNPYFTIL